MAPDLTARPTLYKGIQMRSRLEAGYAAWLDTEGIEWQYEPRVYASERGQYLPDFILPHVQIVLGHDFGTEIRTVVVETKPTKQFWEEAQGRMEVLIDAFGDDYAILIIDTPEGMLLRECHPDGRWVVGQWVDPFYGPPVLAIHRYPPWHGEWWKDDLSTPQPTPGRARIGSAVRGPT